MSRSCLSPQMIAHFEAGAPQAAPGRCQAPGPGARPRTVSSSGCAETLDETRFADHFATAVELERLATVIKCYGASLVPRTLQTGGLRDARCSGPGSVNPTERDVEKLVANRLERATILDERGGPCLWVLLDEHVLRRPVGRSGQPWPLQLRHIAALGRRRRARTHVIPFAAGPHALMESMLVLMRFTDAPSVAYVEGVQTGRVLDDPAVVDTVRSLPMICPGRRAVGGGLAGSHGGSGGEL